MLLPRHGCPLAPRMRRHGAKLGQGGLDKLRMVFVLLTAAAVVLLLSSEAREEMPPVTRNVSRGLKYEPVGSRARWRKARRT